MVLTIGVKCENTRNANKAILSLLVNLKENNPNASLCGFAYQIKRKAMLKRYIDMKTLILLLFFLYTR